jgi:hypothetical protein
MRRIVDGGATTSAATLRGIDQVVGEVRLHPLIDLVLLPLEKVLESRHKPVPGFTLYQARSRLVKTSAQVGMLQTTRTGARACPRAQRIYATVAPFFKPCSEQLLRATPEERSRYLFSILAPVRFRR